MSPARHKPPCRNVTSPDDDLWFSPVPADRDLAKRICGTCLQRLGCLAGALKRGEVWGIYGGEDMEQREVARLTAEMAAGVLEVAEVHRPSRGCYTAGCKRPECRRLNAEYVASWRAAPVTAVGTVDLQMELFEGVTA